MHKLIQVEVIAIDGKTLRGSCAREDRKSTIDMVNAFACANKVVLGQLKTAKKSNYTIQSKPYLRSSPLDGIVIEKNRGRIETRSCHV